MDFAAMAELCAPRVAPETLRSIASVESSFNPFAIGVVGGRLQRQPRNLSEALATTSMLEAEGYNYSLGIMQVNKTNVSRYGLTRVSAFDPCANLRVGGKIFLDCYERAGGTSDPLGNALSCYYSGNFTTGHSYGYVAKVRAAGFGNSGALAVLPIAVVATPKATKLSTRRRAPQPLFVSTAGPGTTVAAPDGISTPSPNNQTALLF